MENTKLVGNIVIVNNTGTDLRAFDHEILESLRANGNVPVEIEDCVKATLVGTNPDGSLRYRLDAV